MNKDTIVSLITKWPFAIVILRVLAAVALSFVIALIYFSPKDAEVENQITNIKQKLQVVDQQLKQRHTYIKLLQRHQVLNQTSQQLNSVNAKSRDSLKTILDINKTGNLFISIKTLENQSLSIKSQIKNWNSFYAISESIERMPLTDRVTINKESNNIAELIWVASRFPGGNQ